MNSCEMVVAIVTIVSIAGVLRAKYGHPHQFRGRTRQGEPMIQPDPEAQAMRDEIRQLKSRVATLERIATDTSQTLDREIESLRDRP